MNSKTLILTFAASLAWGGYAFAAEEGEEKKPQRPETERPDRPKGERPGGGRPGQAGGGGGIADVLKKLDTNEDGSISKEEAGDKWARISRMDKNEDGSVGKDEIPQGRPGGTPGGRPGQGGQGGGGGMSPEMIAQIFGRSDANGDGKITADEAGDRWERLQGADTNKDGGVDKEEFGKAMAAMRRGGPGQMFDRADKNKDGKLTEDEVPAEAWARLKNADKNGDGAISKDELPQRPGGGKGGPPGQGGKGKGKGGPGGGAGPAAMISRMDKNGDGKLSKDEVPAEMWVNLSKADDNADGLVSAAEFEKVMSQRPGGGKGKGKDAKGGKGKDGPGRPEGDKKPKTDET